MVTCGCAFRCCCGLRTPAAYLYWGTVRTAGVAAAAAAAGRGPIVCVDVLAKKTNMQVCTFAVLSIRTPFLQQAFRLTNTLCGHDSWNLWRSWSHSTEWWSGSGWADSTGHILECYIWRYRHTLTGKNSSKPLQNSRDEVWTKGYKWLNITMVF